MMRKKILLATLIAAAAGFVANAQNFDPTVEVTNDFISNMTDARKQSVQSSLPDSLTRFNLGFDYEVFSTPYKDSYNFTPYNVMFIADDDVDKRPYLYLNAGAGYGLHPVLTAVVSPRMGKKFTMDIYQNLSGYYGPYETFSGYDLNEQAGVQGSLRLDALDLSFNAGYNGLFEKDLCFNAGKFHSFDGSIRATSSDIAENFMTYDVRAAYSFGTETTGPAPLRESAFRLSGSVAPTIQYDALSFLLDFNTGYTGYYGTMDSAIYNIEATPKFLFKLWKFNFSTGLDFSYLSRMGNNQFHVYPDVNIDIRFFKDRLDLFVGLTGKDHLNSYSALKKANHHFNYGYAAAANDILSCTRERINVFGGFAGSIGSVFQYDVRGGYVVRENAPLWGIDPTKTVANLVMLDYNSAYVDASTKVKTRPVEFTAGVHYRHADINPTRAFNLPTLSTDAEIVYNWHRRLFVGASLETVSGREMMLPGWTESYKIDPFYNFGLSFELKTSRFVSLWLRGDNLLNQKLERVPGIVETGIGNGIWFTAGIRLDLR